MRWFSVLFVLVVAAGGGAVSAQLDDGPRWKMDEISRDPEVDYPATEEKGTGMVDGVPLRHYKRPDAGAYIFNQGGPFLPPGDDRAICYLKLDNGRAHVKPYYPGYSHAAVVEAEAVAKYRMVRDQQYTGQALHTTCWAYGGMTGWLNNTGDPTYSRIYGRYYIYSPTEPDPVDEEVAFDFSQTGQGASSPPKAFTRRELLLQEDKEVTQSIRLDGVFAEADYEVGEGNEVDAGASPFWLRVETEVEPAE
ncbi:MAG: hypothetical protein ACE5R4_18780 [Armatimonadota bacterium]